MGAQTIFRHQITDLQHRLYASHDMLGAIKVLEPGLYRNVHICIEQTIDDKQQRLQALSDRHVTRTRAASADAGYDDCSSEWAELQTIRAECHKLFEMCLALLGGILVRHNQIDHGLCSLADAMLRDLALRAHQVWEHVTVVAVEDKFEDLTDLLCLRFPGDDIWNLPIVVRKQPHA